MIDPALIPDQMKRRMSKEEGAKLKDLAQVTKPIRIRRQRSKGWKMPPNTKSVTRPGPFGNPFRVGSWMMVGDQMPKGWFRMAWCKAASEEIANRTPGKFTLIKTPAMAVEFFERLCATGFFSAAKLSEIRGINLACWCPVGAPCHADVLLRIANE